MDKEINFSAADPRQQTISVFCASDREVLSEVELERHFTGAAIRRNMVFHERYRNGPRSSSSRRGYGIHIRRPTRTGYRTATPCRSSFSNGFKTSASVHAA